VTAIAQVRVRHTFDYYWRREPVLVLLAAAFVVSLCVSGAYLCFFRSHSQPPMRVTSIKDEQDDDDNDDDTGDDKKTK
jgi:hypothetical protein